MSKHGSINDSCCGLEGSQKYWFMTILRYVNVTLKLCSVCIPIKLNHWNFITYQPRPSIYRVSPKKVYSSFLGKRWSKCLLKLTSFTQCKPSSIIWPSFKIIGHTQTTHTTKPQAQVRKLAWLKIDMFTLILRSSA